MSCDGHSTQDSTASERPPTFKTLHGIYAFLEQVEQKLCWYARQDLEGRFKLWVYKHMICKISSANRMLPLTFPYLNWLKKAASFTVGCIESRWTLKHKPEVKVLTLMCVVLNSWALFPLSF